MTDPESTFLESLAVTAQAFRRSADRVRKASPFYPIQLL